MKLFGKGPKVPSGRKAFEEYKSAEGLGSLSLIRIDQSGVYCVKP